METLYFEFEKFGQLALVDGKINQSFIDPLISKLCIGYYGYPVCTPLVWAVRKQQTELVKYLLDHGSNDLEDAVHNAVWFNLVDMTEYLRVQYGGNIHKPGLMVTAVESTKVDIVKYLYGHGVSLTWPDRHNNSPVFVAALFRYWNIVVYFYQRGIRLNAEELKRLNETKNFALPENVQAYHV